MYLTRSSGFIELAIAIIGFVVTLVAKGYESYKAHQREKDMAAIEMSRSFVSFSAQDFLVKNPNNRITISYGHVTHPIKHILHSGNATAKLSAQQTGLEFRTKLIPQVILTVYDDATPPNKHEETINCPQMQLDENGIAYTIALIDPMPKPRFECYIQGIGF